MSHDQSALSPGGIRGAISSGAKLKKNRYEILKVLSQGNFGITYLARDSSLQRAVAIKEYLPRRFATFRDRHDNVQLYSRGQDFNLGLEVFLKEIRTLAKFDDSSIAKVCDFFKANGTAYAVTNYEPGESLSALLEQHRHLPEQKILRIIFPLLEGIGMMHAEGIQHRDIKPSDIIVRPNGSPCLLDSCTAPELLSKQQLLGSSPYYSAPERFDKRAEQGPWTDIYSLGAICYRIVTGQQPQSALTRLKAVRSREPDPLPPAQEVSQGHYRLGFLRAVDGALRLDPAQRPQNTFQWREMMVPTGVGTHIADRKNGSLLGRLLHPLRSFQQHPSRPVQEAESEPLGDAITVPAVDGLLTEPQSAPPPEQDSKPTGSIDYRSAEPAELPALREAGEFSAGEERATAPARSELSEPPSLPEADSSRPGDETSAVSAPLELAEDSSLSGDDRRPLELEKAAAPAHSEFARRQFLQQGIRPASTAEEWMSPKTGELPQPATTEPSSAITNTRSIEASAIPEGGAPPNRAKPPTEIPVGASTADQGIETPTTQDGGFHKLFDARRQPSTTQSVGAEEHPPRLGTPQHENEWSNLFDLHAQPPSTADVFTTVQTSFNDSPARLPANNPQALVDAAVSGIAAHNHRAWQLFRDNDLEGALAELETARTLEPENPTLLANIKRIQQHLQGPTEPEGDPWATP